jgi:hypothetical protein
MVHEPEEPLWGEGGISPHRGTLTGMVGLGEAPPPTAPSTRYAPIRGIEAVI